ncbi:MAG: carbon starvation protein A [Candidatus Adiutrix sp.]|nr:carbon starvation protein A [Candidatus Adiutrix sp.]
MPPIIYFFLSVAALLAGYMVYGRLVERVFRPDENRATPTVTMADGVDYVSLPAKEVWLNQFLCISATGPVFGPILGILYGPAALLWIVLGCIFAGGVHDYLSGMMSIRYRGESIPDVVGHVLGPAFKVFMRLFSLLLLVLVGVVFVQAPASLLDSLTRMEGDYIIWLVLIFAYYFLVTIMPIEVLIERLNPFFAVVLSIMALGVIGSLLTGDYNFYQWADWHKPHPDGYPLWPLMFITIACGALSGFHATQSPITARCMVNERQGRLVFYGAMIVEGVIALIWATAGMTLFPTAEALNEVLNKSGPAKVVSDICFMLLGEMGGMMAVLGVVVLPVTSGDTAFRAARLVMADFLRLPQKSIWQRLLIAVPIFAVAIYLSRVNFSLIWQYFGWSNQTLATIVLWAGAAYLVRLNTCHWIATIPATFMTAVVSTYIYYHKIGFSIPYEQSVIMGGVTALASLVIFLACRRRLAERVPLELPPLK